MTGTTRTRSPKQKEHEGGQCSWLHRCTIAASTAVGKEQNEEAQTELEATNYGVHVLRERNNMRAGMGDTWFLTVRYDTDKTCA